MFDTCTLAVLAEMNSSRGDLRVRPAVGNQAQHLELPGGQAQRRRRGRPVAGLARRPAGSWRSGPAPGSPPPAGRAPRPSASSAARRSRVAAPSRSDAASAASAAAQQRVGERVGLAVTFPGRRGRVKGGQDVPGLRLVGVAAQARAQRLRGERQPVRLLDRAPGGHVCRPARAAARAGPPPARPARGPAAAGPAAAQARAPRSRAAATRSGDRGPGRGGRRRRRLRPARRRLALGQAQLDVQPGQRQLVLAAVAASGRG